MKTKNNGMGVHGDSHVWYKIYVVFNGCENQEPLYMVHNILPYDLKIYATVWIEMLDTEFKSRINWLTISAAQRLFTMFPSTRGLVWIV